MRRQDIYNTCLYKKHAQSPCYLMLQFKTLYVHGFLSSRVCTRIYTCMYSCLHVYGLLSTRVRTPVYTCMYSSLHVYGLLSTRVCTRVYRCMDSCVQVHNYESTHLEARVEQHVQGAGVVAQPVLVHVPPPVQQ